jgi:hypothetical protein
MQEIDGFARHPLEEEEIHKVSKIITRNLLAAFNLGERDPLALHRAALQGIKPVWISVEN